MDDPGDDAAGHTPDFSRATRFTLWETKVRFYLVAYNTAQTCFRVLKIDRSPGSQPQGQAVSQKRCQADDPTVAAAAATTSSASQRTAARSANANSGVTLNPAVTTVTGHDTRTTPDANPTNPQNAGSGSAEPTALPPPSGVGRRGDHNHGFNAPETSYASFVAPTNPNPPRSISTTPNPTPNPASASFWTLAVTAEKTTYDRTQITKILDMVSDGNRANGGLKEVGHFFGLVGFIRFTSTYYMVLISRRSVVALVGGHYIYHCDETKILPVCHASITASIIGRTKAMDQEEARLLHTFKQVDLGKNFYFSYTYDLTCTLQENLTGRRFESQAGSVVHSAWGYSEKFIWNHHLLFPAFGVSEIHTHPEADPTGTHDWVLPLCHGFVDQAKLSVLSRTVHVTLIARRSRHFAGARFLKRGANEAGQVANDVETEQIVSEALTTPFYAPAYATSSFPSRATQRGRPEHLRLAQNPRFTSYVMHRGSIPIFWTQDSTNMSPRPPIEISVVDPYYSAAALHFDDLFARYGCPIIILNLIKSKEKTPRETKLLHAFGECVSYLNQFLPPEKKMIYIAWDMSRASKSHDQDVIGVLEDIAEEAIEKTGFFHSGAEPTRFEFSLSANGVVAGRQAAATPPARRSGILMQTGVARVNCVDCLDRTNAAQFVIGKAAFGHQLHALGLLEQPTLSFDSDAVDMLTEMYHDLGDTIALQYGGSHLVNTMETYRKINQWTSHSRDMLEGLKRYYANSFVDADKQAAINLFLGIDEITVSPSGATRPAMGASTITIKTLQRRKQRDYQQWFSPAHLSRIEATTERISRLLRVVQQKQNFWEEYYRPRLFTDLMRHHAFKMTAVLQHLPHPARLNSPARDGSRLPQSPSKRQSRGNKESISNLPMITASFTSASSAVAAAVLSSPNASASSHTTITNAHDRKGATVWPIQQDASALITSPFTSRHSHSRVQSTNSLRTTTQRLRTTSGSSTASATSSIGDTSGFLLSARSFSGPADAKAFVGGMKRWMSLNQRDNTTASLQDQDSRGKRRRAMNRGVSSEAFKPGEKNDRGSTNNVGTNVTPIGNWLNPFVPASQTHPTAASLLEEWQRPIVDAQEGREYALWIQQFEGHLALQAREPVWDALLLDAANLVIQDLHSGDAHLSDGDLHLYMRAARKARIGGVNDLLVPSDLTTGGIFPSTASIGSLSAQQFTMDGQNSMTTLQSQVLSTDAASTNFLGCPTSCIATPSSPKASVDPILLNYASLASGGNATLNMHVGIKGANENKVRSYRSWLNVGRKGA